MRRFLRLLPFLVVVVGGGLVIGGLTAPGEWYESLTKPAFNPPNWLFGPVWTILYVAIAVAGYRVREVDPSGPAMKAWIAQLVLNFLWSPTFFALHRPGLALVVVLAMLASVLVFMVLAWRRDRTAALLFVPYAAWVAFASLLNAAIVALNQA